ncbi:MAG: hypothetical protein ACLQUZ_08385 [Rhizomicrobium sp.]
MSLSTQMSRGNELNDTIRQRSGWLIPIGVFALTTVLSAMVLLFYLAPTPTSFIEEHPAPTSRTDVVALSVGSMRLRIPANYILYKSARQGGPRKDVALITSFPDYRGYSDWQSQLLASNAADSPVIYMLIREDPLNLTEAERLQRIYLNFVTDPAGKPGPFGLTQYTFRDDSGYRGEDLFVGETPGAPVVLRCVRFSQQVPSPSCLREIQLKHGVVLSYRFKRAHLADWLAIAGGIDALIHSFRAHAK